MNSTNSSITGPSYTDILLDFIRVELLDGSHDLDEHTPLLEYGVIDSISMISILSFIREQFGVEVVGDDITADNFQDARAIASMVARVLSRNRDMHVNTTTSTYFTA